MYWTLPKDRVEELEDMDSEEEDDDQTSAAALVDGSVHSGKPDSDGGESGQALVRQASTLRIQSIVLVLVSIAWTRQPQYWVSWQVLITPTHMIRLPSLLIICNTVRLYQCSICAAMDDDHVAHSNNFWPQLGQPC